MLYHCNVHTHIVCVKKETTMGRREWRKGGAWHSILFIFLFIPSLLYMRVFITKSEQVKIVIAPWHCYCVLFACVRASRRVAWSVLFIHPSIHPSWSSRRSPSSQCRLRVSLQGPSSCIFPWYKSSILYVSWSSRRRTVAINRYRRNSFKSRNEAENFKSGIECHPVIHIHMIHEWPRST
jgi:hypothetical protein